MSSEQAKESIVFYCDHLGIPSVEKDWKRTSKKLIDNTVRPIYARIFHNAKINLDFVEIDESVFIDGEYLFWVGQTDMGLCASFSSVLEWKQKGNLPDSHLQSYLEYRFGLSSDWEELMENHFAVPEDMSLADAKTYLRSLGFKTDPTFTF